ncbi:MAG: DUF2851 family protein, partial [Owenweeksia sp.]
MTEDFIHYIWRFKKFNILSLQTSEGEPLIIKRTGTLNTDAGPDFSDARIIIGDQLWAGNVEIHIRSSDWKRHNHQSDRAYNNVILHVVYENDTEVFNANGSTLPTLELKGLFDEKLYWKYERLLNNQTSIPCENHLPGVSAMIRENWVERVLVERLSDKSGLIGQWLRQNQNDWNATFYQWLGRGFGLKINAEPMLLLARNIPWQVVLKHRQRKDQLEALFFGVAGMLEEGDDAYTLALKSEYEFLRHKHGLQGMKPEIWKYARLRPAAFPALRIAQLSALLNQHDTLFSKIMQAGSIDQVKELLTPEVSEYWKNHYRFGKITDQKVGEIGNGFREVLIINVLIPFLFVYGMAKDEPFYK